MERAQIENDLNIGYATHPGMTGKHNEDSFNLFAWWLDQQRIIYLGVVADGVGGQTAGEIASQLAVRAVEKYFDQQEQVDDVSFHLEQAILAANLVVYQASQENPEYQGMSTTIVVVAIVDNSLYTAYVGDSRIYLLRNGLLQQVSLDHTWAQEAIEAGLLTPEQARVHPNRNVIRRHLGGQPQVDVDCRMVLEPGQADRESEVNQGTPLKPGDTLLLCSDGLTDMINDAAVLTSLQTHFTDLPAASQELVEKANQAGGKDNITVLLMQIPLDELTLATMVPAQMKSAAEPIPATQAAVTATRGHSSIWLIAGGAIVLVLLTAALVVLFVFSSSLRRQGTPSPTPELPISPVPTFTVPTGVPATAAILATRQDATSTAEDVELTETPELIPTLRATLTPSPVIRPTRIVSPTTEVPLTLTPVSTEQPSTQPSDADNSNSTTEETPAVASPTAQSPAPTSQS